ncbi:hypothetical protein SNE35_31650 [Paucibacter sp. R3-3]|uniref:Extradiol ring-cleavage dioxygenase LigAB LigA subunit domain-containing protein n=1 Tax=Roseateles agri TaxID=3098619 RepID=A0ABU5DSG4_9BURK|nr:hypothetical protein [Paucibacter sp. R3-3]MDY0749094.1 hypothetical protein [Paucibacter sp. R3-3]
MNNEHSCEAGVGAGAGACREGALRPYLEGYSRGNPAALRALRGYDWRAAALGALRRRQARLLGVLDDATLMQLARGTLNLGASAARIADELEEKQDPVAKP